MSSHATGDGGIPPRDAAERVAGFKELVADVREGRFPGPEHVVNASDEMIDAFVGAVDGSG